MNVKILKPIFPLSKGILILKHKKTNIFLHSNSKSIVYDNLIGAVNDVLCLI